MGVGAHGARWGRPFEIQIAQFEIQIGPFEIQMVPFEIQTGPFAIKTGSLPDPIGVQKLSQNVLQSGGWGLWGSMGATIRNPNDTIGNPNGTI